MDVYWVLSGARLGGSVPPSLFLQQGSWAVPVSIPRQLMQGHEANRGQTQDPSPLAIGSKPKLPATLLPASVSPAVRQSSWSPPCLPHVGVRDRTVQVKFFGELQGGDQAPGPDITTLVAFHLENRKMHHPPPCALPVPSRVANQRQLEPEGTHPGVLNTIPCFMVLGGRPERERSPSRGGWGAPGRGDSRAKAQR